MIPFKIIAGLIAVTVQQKNLFCLLCPLKFPRSTKPAPHFRRLAGRIGQHRPSPALWCASPHPLQNRVPRVQVLLPLPKTGGNTAFLPAFFFYVLYGCGIRAGSDSGFSHSFSPILTRLYPLQHPKRTRFCPFLAFPGAFLCFLPCWTRKIFRLVFVHSDS